jgi:ubiquinone/menaquinone biosynthesis C-methylase UbiE
MSEPVGQFLDVSTAARRPRGVDELRAYGIMRRLRGAAVIDIGCGDGRLAFAAARAGASRVVGVDPDPDALRAARRLARQLSLPNVSFRLGAAQRLPVPKERFDIAILSWAL